MLVGVIIFYCQRSAEFGSFFNKRKFSDGVLRFTGLYVSKLFAPDNLFKGRILFRGQYVRGLRRSNANDQIDLNDIEALRGRRSELLFGNTVFAAGVSLSLFTPWYLFGFRLALFSLADLTYFSKRDAFVFSGRPYWGFSNGIRLNNQNFLIGTINISISVYPAPPAGTGFFSFGISINPIFPFPNFIGKKPGVVTYGNPNKIYY